MFLTMGKRGQPPLLCHSAQFTCPSCKSCKHPFFKTICTTLTARISASYPSRVLCWCYHLLSQRTFSCQFIISAKNSPIYFLEVVFFTGSALFQIIRSSFGLNDKTRWRDSFLDPTQPPRLTWWPGLLALPSAPFYPLQLLVLNNVKVRIVIFFCFMSVETLFTSSV